MNLVDKISRQLIQYKFPFTINDIQNFTYKSAYIGSYLYENSNNMNVNDFFKLYEDCIELAIRNSNWKLVKCMWECYYYHDRNCPDFTNIYQMAEFGNVETFILGLEGVLNWSNL